MSAICVRHARRAVRSGPTLAVLCVLLGLSPRSEADIYSYADRQGVAHYSNVPSDSRYVLFLMALPAPGVEPAPAGPAPQTDRRARETDHAGPAPHTDRRARETDYEGLIDRAARRHALEPALLRSVISVESAFNPRAVSRAGAQGLMQLLPQTARRYGVDNAFDPEQNVLGGARYLSDLLKRYGNNLELALAAYNAGEGAVDRHGRQVPPYPETRAYVPAVLRQYRERINRLQPPSRVD